MAAILTRQHAIEAVRHTQDFACRLPGRSPSEKVANEFSEDRTGSGSGILPGHASTTRNVENACNDKRSNDAPLSGVDALRCLDRSK
jgi:hypothetical protein